MSDSASRIFCHLLDQSRIPDCGSLVVTLTDHTTKLFGCHGGLADMWNPFGLVGIQEGRCCQTSFYQRELPDQVQSIADSLTHALSQEGRRHVCGIP
ncbi:hypothetical protein D3C86_2043340 [compost metagenome]